MTSTFSEQNSILAIGGIEGRLLMYDTKSKSKLGVNDNIHNHEVLNIFFCSN